MDRNKLLKRKPSRSPSISPEKKPQTKASKTTDSPQVISDSSRLIFGPRNGDNQGGQEFAHLSTEDKKINLFISGKRFANAIKKSSQIYLDDDSIVKIDKVIDVTGLSTMGGGLDKNLIGLFSGAHALNDVIEKSSSKAEGSTAVLIHCTIGHERSVSTALLYLMGYQGYSNERASSILNEALELGREEDKEIFFKQSKDSESSHNAKIAETFNHVDQGEMKKRMKDTTELAEFFLLKNTPPKTLVKAYRKPSSNPIDIKIQVPTGLGGKSNTDALIKVLQGISIEKALTKQETLEAFKAYQQQPQVADTEAGTSAEKLRASAEPKAEKTDIQSASSRDSPSMEMNNVAARGSNLANRIKALQEGAQALESPDVSKEDSNQSTPFTPPSPQ